MPVKRSSFLAVFLTVFISGLLFSCKTPQSTTSNVTKYCRLYLSAPASESDKDISDEVAKITTQLNRMVDSIDRSRKGYDPSRRYTLGYSINTLTVDGKKIIEVQYYLVRSRVTNPDPARPPGPRPAPNLQNVESADDTGHTPPQCPRPKPGIMTKYNVEGWVCE